MHELVEVTSRSRPDPTWRHVDARGHEHRWHADGAPMVGYQPGQTHTLPTLVWVWDDPPLDEDSDETRRGHYACATCGAAVTPGRTADTSRQFIRGLQS